MKTCIKLDDDDDIKEKQNYKEIENLSKTCRDIMENRGNGIGFNTMHFFQILSTKKNQKLHSMQQIRY